MINGIHHACLSTSDFDRLVEFYCDVIGAERTWIEDIEGPDFEALVGHKGARMKCGILKLGNAFIEVQQYLEPPATALHDPQVRRLHHLGISHICLNVTDAFGEYNRLTAAGMTFIAPPSEIDGFVRTVFGRDPDGNLLELQELLVDDHPIVLPTRLGTT